MAPERLPFGGHTEARRDWPRYPAGNGAGEQDPGFKPYGIGSQTTKQMSLGCRPVADAQGLVTGHVGKVSVASSAKIRQNLV